MDPATRAPETPRSRTRRRAGGGRAVLAAAAVLGALVLSGCASADPDPAAPSTPVASAPEESPSAPAPSETPEPSGPPSASPTPTETTPEPETALEPSDQLTATFEAMLAAAAADGPDGVVPFMADQSRGDVWGIADYEWTDPECSENTDVPSGCVAWFTKADRKLENVFLFEKTDGVWLLIESYVWEE